MIVGFSKYGKGQGTAAIDYLLSKDGRKVAPVILDGDPKIVLDGINQNPNKWKYTSGVLSFAPEDTVSDEKERQLIAGFEEVAFAGIDPENRPQGLWVRHHDKDHHEMHFIYPRQLNDLRSYNMRPPSDKGRYDAFRDVHNLENGWADPNDPERRRSLSLPDFIARDKEGKKDIREALHQWAEQRIEAGVVNNRSELIEQLKEEGFDVPRSGREYITIGREGEKIRLKGEIYAETFTSREQLGKNFSGRKLDYQRSLPKKLEKARERVASYNRGRAKQNQKRYGRAEQGFEQGQTFRVMEGGSPKRGDLSLCIDRHLGMGGDYDREGNFSAGGVAANYEESSRRRRQAKEYTYNQLRGKGLYSDSGGPEAVGVRREEWLLVSDQKVERRKFEERWIGDEYGRGLHGNRQRINNLCKEVDRSIERSKSAVNRRKSAVNDRKSIVENFARGTANQSERTGRIFGTVHRQIKQLGNGIEELKEKCQPMIERVRKAATARLKRSNSRGFSL